MGNPKIRLLTVQRMAVLLSVPVPTISRLLDSNPDIEPSAWANSLALYDAPDLARLRYEINRESAQAESGVEQ